MYYWKKNEAQNLYAQAGVQFPGSAVQDGLIHSILKKDSPVNRKFVEQTETRQFKRWFGKSKVVDRDGEPLVVYHGTEDDFTVFDPWKTNYGDVSEGYSFFTNKKNGYADSAQDYANRHKNGHVMETYLKIEKPLRLKSDGYFTPVHYYDENYLDIDVQFLSGEYDGIIIENSDKSVDDSVIYLVQNPNQIKSATDNVGTFANIRYFVSLCRNGLSAAPKHPSLRYFCPVPTQATAEQSGDRQRRGKGSPILMAEKGEHERVPRAGESYPTPLRATLRAPTSKWAVEAFFRRVSAASRGRGQPRRGYRRPKPTARSDVGRLRSRRAAGFLLHTFLSPPKEKCERPMGQ